MTSANPLPTACARRYRASRLLGEGGFASVWLATQLELNREVVVKVLHAELLDSPTLVERFLNEARITATLRHPNIVILIDHGVDEGVPWIVYEYLPRGTLSAAIARGPMPWREAMTCAEQVASALAEAHAHDVLHRDIKPANVLEAAPGQWKVVDFGVAKWTMRSNVQTKEGLLVGSPAYLAPEQLIGAPASPRSDLYALGVVLFQALSGSLPPRGAVAAASVPTTLAATAPPAVLAVVERLLALEPEGRPASARELAAELADLLRKPVAALTRARPALAPTPVAGSPRPRTGGAAALGLGLVAAGAVAFSWRAPTPPPVAWTPLPDATPSARAIVRSPAEALKTALERYQQTPAGDRRARWGWAREPGLAEAIRAALEADVRGHGPRLAAWLRGIEDAERTNPLYWACRGLAQGSGPALRDLTDIDTAALAGMHDAYTGLYLALERGEPAVLAECALLATERVRSWRPRNSLFEDEWTAWRRFHLHHAQDLAGVHLPEELERRLALRLDELHRALTRVPAGRAVALGLNLPATPPELATFNRLLADVEQVLPGLAPLELSLALRAGRRALGDARLSEVDRWIDQLEPWGADRSAYWLMRMAWMVEADRTPEARVAYLRGLDRWFHGAPPRETEGLRVLHERFLELFLARLVSAETVGTHGDFGVAMDFATQVEGSIRGTRATEESMTSLQRATCCAHLELIAGDPAKATAQRQRAFAKAQLYRATLISRATHGWLLASAHDRAEQAMTRLGASLSAERGEAMRAELVRLRALRKQVSK